MFCFVCACELVDFDGTLCMHDLTASFRNPVIGAVVEF
jgi:hypothetical protein